MSTFSLIVHLVIASAVLLLKLSGLLLLNWWIVGTVIAVCLWWLWLTILMWLSGPIVRCKYIPEPIRLRIFSFIWDLAGAKNII